MPATVTDRLNGLTTSVAVKAPCVAVANSNVTLAGLQTVGGVALAADDRVLLIGQTDDTENGIYNADSGDWTRARDFDGARDVVQGTLVLVRNQFIEGAFYEVTSTNPITIGTSAITFRLRDSPNITYDLTQSEIDEGVTIIDYGRLPGDFVRYGFSPDATAAVNVTAANAAMATNSLCFCNDPGTYAVNAPLLAQSNQTIRFAQGVIIQASAAGLTGGAIFKIDECENVQVYGGVFDGNKAAIPAGTLNGVVLFNSDKVKLFGVIAQNCPSDNVTLGAAGDGFYIGGFAGGSPGCNNIELIGCSAFSNVRQGLSVVRALDWRVIGGEYSDTTGNAPGAGIDVEANPGLGTVESGVIQGVTLRGNHYGIVLTEGSKNITVTGCNILGSRNASLLLSTVQGCTIVGNVMIPAQTVSGPIVDVVVPTGVMFANNYIEGQGTGSTADTFGLRFQQGNDNFVACFNIFKNTRFQGVAIGSSAIPTAPTRVSILNNTFIDCVLRATAGATTGVIAISGNSTLGVYPLFIRIAGNIIRDTRSAGVTTAGVAIAISTSIPAAVQADYRVTNNVITGVDNQYTAGTFPPLLGGVAWNPGNLVDGAGETSPDITVNGAAFGDAVMVFTPYDLVGVTCTAYVKAANTCSIRLQNETGVAFDGANGTWRVRAIKSNES